MDNGQQRQSNGNQVVDDFFTAGAGTQRTNENGFDAKNNLDLNSNGAANWGEAPERNLREVGGNVMASSSEALPPSPESPDNELGKIVNLEMPPGHQETENPSAAEQNALDTATSPKETADAAAFRAEHDHISSATLNLTQQAIREFEAGKKTPAELYDYVWEAKKAYAKNSFGRELEGGTPVVPGADKEARKGIAA